MSDVTMTTASASGGRRARARRLILMVSVPLIMVGAGLYAWATGGRYVGTDNAYIQQDMVSVAAEVSGRIVTVNVRENGPVKQGQVLFEIDPEPFRIALAQADANLANARLGVEQLRATYSQERAALEETEQALDYRRREYDRQSKLAGNGYATQARLDEVRNDLRAAEQGVAKARQGVAAALAGLGGDPAIPTDQHPSVMQAQAAHDRAALDLNRTRIVAPADGIASQTDRLRVGQYMATGLPALSLVETGHTYIEANYKETDLTHMKPGQTATLVLDAYPDRTLTAQVESIGAGTGSEFSLLPAQNATGNWVKVVQRVPVRLKLDNPAAVPLRAGLSVNVEVDTGHARGFPGFATAQAAPSR